MNHYRKVTFTHANLKRPVSVIAGTIAFWHWSEPVKATVVYTTAGALPVEETDEQITKMIESLNSPNGQEQK